MFFVYSVSISQNIYNVGNYAGFSKVCHSSGVSQLDIYSVGDNDGFAKKCYSQSGAFLDIYTVGIDDGFSKDCYSSGSSQLDIYSVANDDGFAHTCVQKTTLLPVVWLDFTANVEDNNDVLLKWITVSEINNDYFILQHSADAVNWKNIYKVKGSGNSNEIIEYSYLDEEANMGVNYYRIIQVDYDNSLSLSKIVSARILNGINEADIKIYPNPVLDKLYISGKPADVEFALYNVNGVLLLKTNNNVIDMSSLKKGFYFIKMKGVKNNMVFKVIKE